MPFPLDAGSSQIIVDCEIETDLIYRICVIAMAATVYLSILGEAKHQSESSEGHSEPRRNYCWRFLFPSALLKVFLMLLLLPWRLTLSVALATVLVASHPLLGAEEPLHNRFAQYLGKG